MKSILEGLLFVVGDDGLTIDEISKILEITTDESKILVLELKKDYEENNRGIRIDFLGNTFKLTTRREHKDYYEKLIQETNSSNLSQAALEIIAIIIYNQPVTRIKVDEIRGIGSAHIIRKLVAKNFLKEIGREESPGRPILYKTTNDLLDYFGISSLDDLPKLEEKNEEYKETDLFSSKYKE